MFFLKNKILGTQTTRLQFNMGVPLFHQYSNKSILGFLRHIKDLCVHFVFYVWIWMLYEIFRPE